MLAVRVKAAPSQTLALGELVMVGTDGVPGRDLIMTVDALLKQPPSFFTTIL